LDEGVPWAYNTLLFQCELASGTLELKIVPSYGELEFRFRGRESVLELELRDVAQLEVTEYKNAEGLGIISGRPGVGRVDIQLRPVVKVQWKMPFDPTGRFVNA